MASHTDEIGSVHGGVPVRWEEARPEAPGVPVVLVHGIPTSPGLWRHVLPRLDARCLAFELVGYGSSIPAGLGRDISVARQAGYLVDWLDAIGIERAVLVGHDLGGGVAQVVATESPGRCAGLVLTNTIAYDNWPIPSVQVLRAVSHVLRRMPDATVAAAMASLLVRGHDRFDVARASFRVHWPHYARNEGAPGLARQVRSLDVQDTLRIASRLPDLHVPARVVWGAADQFLPLRYGQRLARDLGTEVRPIEGGKHFVPEDHPDEVAEAVGAVLREADTR